MAVTSTFNPTAGLLAVIGDNLANTITASRNAAGRILVNGGAVTTVGGTPTVANTALIEVFGLGGNDIIALDETNGALPAALLFGGAGNDTMTGGSGADQLFGQDGNDTLLGKGGNDLLFGGAGNDVLVGGTGDDQVFGQDGNDRMIWNPGEGTDLFEGGAGTDTAEVNGGNGAETFTITANGTRVRFDRTDPAPFSLDIGTTENLVLNANGGDDVITAGNGLSSLIQLTIDGGAGNDTITGGDGNDTLLGGDGNDLIVGGRGNDLAFLGSGNDTFVWNPGDGSDTVDGQAGNDTLQFNGANISERIDISANGNHVRFTRDVASITMDLHSVEAINFRALGGADLITVHNLVGTGVQQVNVDLSGTAGSGVGDGQADTVIVEGSLTKNVITVTGSGTSVAVTGLPAQVNLSGAEGANDTLVINALDGNDTIDASGLVAGVVRLTVDAGAGNDTVVGSRGTDTLIGGDGNDTITGGAGDDVAFLGAGDDKFVWNPGDGSDIVEGQAGTDTLLFNGSNVNERIDVSANGSRVRFTRDVGTITMDVNGVENVQFKAAGGTDSVVVNDLTGTDVKLVSIDLAATGTTNGDGAADTVTVNGTAAADTIKVTASGATISVGGLPAQVTIAHAEGANDALTVNGLGGDDVIDTSGLLAGNIALTLNGGDGNDFILGSAGNDLIFGGRGDDAALMGAGDDTFVWNPGDGNDIIEGQAGSDTLQFNGANIAERIDISANGGRVRFTRDIASITMDANDTETINFRALGGVDTVTVNDLTGTDVTHVNVDLGGAAGGGDGAVDTIFINGTNGDDVISIANNGGVVTVTGLSSVVTIANFDPTDRIIINGLGGDDVIEASGLGSAMQLTANGGDGNDVLIGSSGNEVLTGGAGDDVLIGGGGLDVLDGGLGDNVVLTARVASSSSSVFAPQAEYDGTAGDDTITVTQTDAGIHVSGASPASVGTSTIVANLAIDGGFGDDVMDASAMAASGMRFILAGGAGNDVMQGSSGDDLLVGGPGADRFKFSGTNGSDTIADFEHGADLIQISGYGAALDSFDDLTGHLSQVGTDVHINLSGASSGAGEIVLQNTQLVSMGARDFSFS